MPVKVYTAHQEHEAVWIKDLLEQNSIPAVIRHNEVPGYGLVSSLEISGWGDVLVHEDNAERAMELVAAFRWTLGELVELEEADDIDSWEPDYPLSEDELEERDEI